MHGLLKMKVNIVASEPRDERERQARERGAIKLSSAVLIIPFVASTAFKYWSKHI